MKVLIHRKQVYMTPNIVDQKKLKGKDQGKYKQTY